MRSVFEEVEGASLDGFMALSPVRGADGRVEDFECSYVNPSAERLLGRAPGTLQGQGLLAGLPPFQEGDFSGACRRVVEVGEPEALELRDAGDERRWLRVSLARCRAGVTARLLDISAQKQAEAGLVDWNMPYQLVSQATNDVLWDWDLRTGSIRWGEAIYNVLGYKRHEVRGSLEWWLEQIHPEDRERVARGLKAAIHEAADAWGDEYRFRRADGSYAFFLDRGFVARDERGRPCRMLGSMVDLSERVRAEEALLESEERFRATFTQAAVGMALISPGGTWLKCNERLCEIVGFECEELLGNTLEALTHPEDARIAMQQMQRVLAGDAKGHSTEVRCLTKDGAPVWVNLTLSLVRECSGAPKWLVAILEDVHERKRLEEEARRAQEFEAQLHGIVGHDIRSPLAAIKATVSQLLSKPDLTEAQRKAISRIARSTERIQRLVQQLLDYTRIRIGDGLPVHPRPVDLHEVCRRVVEEFSQTHPERIILCRQEADGHGAWDPDRLMQLLSNLVENALKYGAPDAPVSITLGGSADEVVIRVHNLGEAIPPRLVPTLFEPFRRGAQNEQTVKVSLGLGLYVVREVVRAHGGTVEVQSTREEGTTFTVSLPRYPVVHSLRDDAAGASAMLH